MTACSLCPHRCGAARTDTTGAGRCGCPSLPVVARAALHRGEEPCISGEEPGGSGTVFFSGCTLGCVYCQNHVISRSPVGRVITVERLAAIFRELVEQGAYNINLVNPTQYVPAIRAALLQYRPPVPVVYNSGGWERVETLRALDGLIDVYLPDVKYASPALAQELSGAASYPEAARLAVAEMARQTGPMVLDDKGLVQRGTMVRHLVLPGHTNDSLQVLDWLAESLPTGCFVSLMFQYTPMAPVAGHPELSRRLTGRECEKVWQHLLRRDLTEGYVQQRESAGHEMIPVFDLTGV